VRPSEAEPRAVALPRMVIHGELYPSNVLVAGERICPVDWEMAGSGPGIVDLAALASGFRSEETEAILAACGDADRVAFDCARLPLAVRWPGWSRAWSPPLQHEHDWRAEVLDAAERLESTLR
jgi:thiamine kinase-like enzyme